MVNIFVIEYEGGRYFVATSDTQAVDYETIDCEWLGDNQPLNIIKRHANCSQDDVDKCTIYHMYHKGIDNVRGGRFTNDQIQVEDLDFIREEFTTIKKYMAIKQKPAQSDIGTFINSISSLFSSNKENKETTEIKEVKEVRFNLPTPTQPINIVRPNINDALLGLNVGGVEFLTCKTVSEYLPRLKEEPENTYIRNNVVYYFYDRDPSYFRDILFWTRYGDVRLTQGNKLHYYMIDMAHFGVNLFELVTPFNKTIVTELPPNNILKNHYCIADNSSLNNIIMGVSHLRGIDIINSKLHEIVTQFGNHVFVRQPGKKTTELKLIDVKNIITNNIFGGLSANNYFIHMEEARMVVYWV
jgi:hypothetical protein